MHPHWLCHSRLPNPKLTALAPAPPKPNLSAAKGKPSQSTSARLRLRQHSCLDSQRNPSVVFDSPHTAVIARNCDTEDATPPLQGICHQQCGWPVCPHSPLLKPPLLKYLPAGTVQFPTAASSSAVVMNRKFTCAHPPPRPFPGP